MPIPVNHFTTDGSFGQTTPITVAYSGVTPGNAIVVYAIEIGVGVTFSTCSDGVATNVYQNELNFAAGSAQGTAAIWRALNVQSTAGTITIPFTGGPGGQMFIFAFEVSGISDYDAGNANANFSGGPANTSGFTLTKADEIIFLAIVGQDNSTYSDPVGYTNIQKVDDSSYRYQTYFKISKSGAQAPTSTMTASANWLGIGAGFFGPGTQPTDAVFYGMT